MDVSVIIVNYNTCRLLLDCLASIYEHTRNVGFEVIVVDNASSDGSESYVTGQFPEVVWVNAGSNLGFGRANNLGACRAKGKYVFLLNSDTLLLNNAIKEFYDYAESHVGEHIGVLGSWLLDKDGNLNNSCGEFPSPRSEIKYLLGKCKIVRMQDKYAGVADVDYVIGADMFISKDVYDEFGGFDPNIFMYYEETDLQYRMAQKGYLRRIIETPRIVHLEGGSFGSKGLTYNRFIMAQKSYDYYLRKHYKGIMYFMFKMTLSIIRLMLFVTTNWSFVEKMRAYKFVLKNG